MAKIRRSLEIVSLIRLTSGQFAVVFTVRHTEPSFRREINSGWPLFSGIRLVQAILAMASHSAGKDRGDLLQLHLGIPWRSMRVGHEQFATAKGMRFMTLVLITYAVQTPDVRKMATPDIIKSGFYDWPGCFCGPDSRPLTRCIVPGQALFWSGVFLVEDDRIDTGFLQQRLVSIGEQLL